MAADLLPCPFCGGPAMLDNSGSGSVDGRGNALARVWCTDPDCNTNGTAWLEEWEAVKVWNRRAAPTAVSDAMVEAAAKAWQKVEKGAPLPLYLAPAMRAAIQAAIAAANGGD